MTPKKLQTLQEACNSFKKWPVNLWWIQGKTIMEIENVQKAATVKSFFHQSYKSTPLLFLCHCFLIIFMTQTLNNNFGGLHENKSRVFPLKTSTLAYVNFTETFLFLNQIQPYKISALKVFWQMWKWNYRKRPNNCT